MKGDENKMKNNLLVLLAKKGMTVKDLSEKTGLSMPTLYSIKNENCKSVKFDTINKICTALECSVDDFIVKEV